MSRAPSRTHAVIALCAVVAACDLGIEAEEGPTFVRFVNVAPDAVGPLNFVLSGGPSAVVQQGQSSSYTELEPRIYPIAIDDDSETWVVQGNVRVNQGFYQTVYAFGDRNSEAAVLLGDEPTPPAPGRSLVRFIHFASALSGNVDVHILDTGETVDPLSPVISDQLFAQQPLYYFLDAGNRRIVITAGGTSNVILEAGPLDFASGAWYSAILYNDNVGQPRLVRIRDGF